MTLKDDPNLQAIETYLISPFHGRVLDDGSKFDLFDSTKKQNENETLNYLESVAAIVKGADPRDYFEDDTAEKKREEIYKDYTRKVIEITRKITNGNGSLIVRIQKDESSAIYGHIKETDGEDRYVILIEGMKDDDSVLTGSVSEVEAYGSPFTYRKIAQHEWIAQLKDNILNRN